MPLLSVSGRAGGIASFICVLVAAACSHSPATGRLTIEYKADLCNADNRCVFLPAAGATVQLFKDGVGWRHVTTDAAGRVSLQVAPGSYSARVELPALKWRSQRSVAVEITRGGGGDITGVLPARHVS